MGGHDMGGHDMGGHCAAGRQGVGHGSLQGIGNFMCVTLTRPMNPPHALNAFMTPQLSSIKDTAAVWVAIPSRMPTHGSDTIVTYRPS